MISNQDSPNPEDRSEKLPLVLHYSFNIRTVQCSSIVNVVERENALFCTKLGRHSLCLEYNPIVFLVRDSVVTYSRPLCPLFSLIKRGRFSANHGHDEIMVLEGYPSVKMNEIGQKLEEERRERKEIESLRVGNILTAEGNA